MITDAERRIANLAANMLCLVAWCWLIATYLAR